MLFDKKLSKKDIESIWERTFGVFSNKGIDVFGRIVYHDEFECVLVLPKELGGKTVYENAIILHPLSVKEKGNMLKGKINNHDFQILNRDGIGILLIDDKIKEEQKVLLDNENDYYQSAK